MAGRRIRIESTGTAPGTWVKDAETGEPILGVVQIEWSCSVDELARVRITFEGVEADVIGESEEG